MKSILLVGILTIGMLLSGVSPASAEVSAIPVKFGMDSASMSYQEAAGVKADYGSFWIGPWTLSSGWSGVDTQLTKMANAGVTPAIHFYYWGDDISPSCVENGCWSSLHNAQKDRLHWEMLADQLVAHLNSKMGGRPVLIFLESEFNKGGIENYEPFDGYMTAMAQRLHQGYPNTQVVLAFGNWGSNSWGNFDRLAAASDMVGIQGMRGSTKQTKDQMMTLYDGLLTGVKTLEAKFPGKPIMLTDIAVSSYPEPEYLTVQSDVLKEVFDNLGVLKAHGVQAIIYRGWLDAPGMNTANYYGMAERYWGLANTGEWKPSATIWVNGVKAERGGATPPTPPPPTPPTPTTITIGATGGSLEAELFTTHTAGGSQNDGAASAGKMWNVWSNGYLQQKFNVTPGRYDVAIQVRGTFASGIAPHMDVTLGGAALLSANPGSTYTEFHATRTLGGATDMRITFTNDGLTSTEDRNLIVDKVTFTPKPNSVPVAAFAATKDGLGLSVDGAGSSDSDGDALTYAWSFGDGATSTGWTATHVYATGGTFTVVLTVHDGSASGTSQQSVVITPPDHEPTATFAATVSELTLGVDASASSDPEGSTLTYAWDFGDGATALDAVASHVYATSGTYSVQLTVSDGSLTGSRSQMVTVNQAPTAYLTATVNDLTVDVNAAESYDGDGDELSYTWDFGDGATATGPTANHTYADAGAFTVTVVVDDGIASATAQAEVVAVHPNRAPMASFTATSIELNVDVDASAASDPDGNPLSYAWDFGDGATATGASASHAYAAAGSYGVQLTVNDGDLTGSHSQMVTVNQAPMAAFTTTGSYLTVTVNATASTDLDGDALTYAWGFGDGTTGTGSTASHTYTVAGTFTVTLAVSDGSASATAQSVFVAIQPNRAPTAAFTTSVNWLTATVNAGSSSDPDGHALSFAWTYGDGTTGTGTTASHTYAASGTFTVGLTVSDGNLTSSATKSVTVVKPNQAPIASFTVTKTGLKASVDASGSRDPDGTALTYAWTFGDGSTATGRTASHTYAKGGTFTVVLKVSDGKVTTSISKAVTVTPPFAASFTPKAVGNDWWVEATVGANQPLAKVQARVDNGAWTDLPKSNWGSYAKSIHAVNGSQVVFRAYSTAGTSVTSASFTWT